MVLRLGKASWDSFLPIVQTLNVPSDFYERSVRAERSGIPPTEVAIDLLGNEFGGDPGKINYALKYAEAVSLAIDWLNQAQTHVTNQAQLELQKASLEARLGMSFESFLQSLVENADIELSKIGYIMQKALSSLANDEQYIQAYLESAQRALGRVLFLEQTAAKKPFPATAARAFQEIRETIKTYFESPINVKATILQ